MLDEALWRRISAHQLDASTASSPFSAKLARAEGWDKEYTDRVIEEYRRFVYLTQISDFQVTPSEAIDRAWHMHLTFTRDYWEVFCSQTLDRPLHHEPCGGDEDMPRYHKQFERTKALYKTEFWEIPPADVWGKLPPWKHIRIARKITNAGVLAFFVAAPAATVFANFAPFAFISFAVAISGFLFANWHTPANASLISANGRGGGPGGAGCGGCGGGGGGCGGGCGGGG